MRNVTRIALCGYGGDDIFQYLHLYEVLRGVISKVRAFFAGTRAATIEQDIPCDLLSVVASFLSYVYFSPS